MSTIMESLGTTRLLTHLGFDGYVPPFGTGSNGVLICGEAPGEQEIKYGVPFYKYAPAGSTLERALSRIGTSRELFTITNVVWERPPNNHLAGAPYESTAVEAYRPALDELINRVRPRVILALGDVALRRFTPYGGKGATISSVRGYVMRATDHDCWVVASYHPSFLVRGQQALTGVLIHDIKRAIDVATNGHSKLPINYVTHPELDDALRFENGYQSSGAPPLAFDIETPESDKLDEEEVEDATNDISYTILRISFSFAEGHAITFPWQEPFISVAKRLLASAGPKRVWNAPFDVPRLIANGCQINGRIYDFMDLWKHLQPTLPRSLGFVAPFYGWDGEPWKHTSWSDPEWYSDADSDALTRNANGIERDLRRINLWDRLEAHVVDLTAILRQMQKNGLPVSVERLNKMKEELTAQLQEREGELQTTAPISVRPIHPKAGYKKTPKDTTGMIQIEIDGQQRWARVEPFNPLSPKQLADYCHLKKYRLGTNRKTKKETTDEDALKKLLKKHNDPVIRLSLECRKLTKVLSTYIEGWKPAADGHVHPVAGFWGKMFRISWRRPNIGATIQDKDEEAIATGFRKCVAAPPGHLLIEGDWKGIEAVIVGYFAGDPEYTRLAKIGVHDYLLSHMLVSDGKLTAPIDLTQPDDVLIGLFKALKKAYHKRRDDAKHVVHGTNYGMGPRLMSAQYGMTIAEATRLQDLYFALFPKVKAWQDATVQQAHSQAKLVNPFGYPMWFWNVYQWDSKKGTFVRGEDAKSAIAFMPRDTAAGILRETLLRLGMWADAGWLRACIHDSILLCVPETHANIVARQLKSEMEQPIPQLGGLVIGSEIKVGPCWHESEMEAWNG